MLGQPSFRELEYTALMERTRTIAKSAASSWTITSIASAAFLAWATVERNPGQLLGAVMCVAVGYYLSLHARRETMLLEGYLQETFEGDSAHWFTKRAQVDARFGSDRPDLLLLAQSQLVAVLSIALAWLFAKNVANGELLAGLTTSAGVAFGLHSVTEHLRYAQATSQAYWQHVTGGTREVALPARKVA